MKIKGLADRFGSNRSNASEPAKHLKGCSTIAVPFCGGLCEVPYFTANVILINDVDRHIVNLAEVVRDHAANLIRQLDATIFHPDILARAQEYCRSVEEGDGTIRPDFDWAFHYFIASWMTRGGKSGTKGEFDAGLSIRWKSGGGDSVVRFRSATEALAEWQKVMRRCTFTTLDCFEFLEECKKRDVKENGVYVDSPWPEDGALYRHKFTDEMHRRLAQVLTGFENTRIVVRFGDHPLVREFYPESLWDWNKVIGRTQANDEKAEVLLVRRR